MQLNNQCGPRPAILMTQFSLKNEQKIDAPQYDDKPTGRAIYLNAVIGNGIIIIIILNFVFSVIAHFLGHKLVGLG